MKRYLIILFCITTAYLKSAAADYTNSLPAYNISYSSESFYGKFKTILLKLDKFSPGTNSYNTFVVSQKRGPFKAKILRDINGDGRIDFLSQTGRVIRIALGSAATSSDTNSPATSFTVTNLVVPLPDLGFKLVATGDIDGDEDIDLILQKGKQVTAYLANGGFYQQSQLKFANSLAPRSKILGAIDQNAKFIEVKTEDQVSYEDSKNNTYFIATTLNTVATPENTPDLIVKLGKELFRYTNSNGLFFPSELPFYTLQPKERFVGIFNTGLSPRISAVSIKSTIIVEPVPPGQAPRNQELVISNNIAIPDIIIQRRREVLALSIINNFSTPILIASNAAGVKIIGPK